MARSGRLRPSINLALTRFIYIFLVIKIVVASKYGVPIEIKLWDSKRTPLAHMVDVTNEFGLKVLAEHNFLNDNNIAFSPYGLMGILVALYEGVDGESSYQIQRSMQLPWNRNVMRIGFRDIHRTLKTYFVPEEGFLAGLALNNENVTFNDSYQKILRFYGFDLNNEQPPSSSPSNTTEDMQTTLSTSNMLTTTEMSTDRVTGREDASTVQTTESTKEETTLNPNAETISDVQVTTTTTPPPTTTKTASSPIDSISSSISASEANPTSEIVTSTTTQESTQTNPTETVSLSTTVETTLTTRVSTDSTSDTGGSTTNSNAETISTQSMTSDVNTMTTGVDSSTTNLDTMSSTQTTETEMSSASLMEAQQTEAMSTDSSTPQSTMPTNSGLETLERKKKSIDFLYTSPPYDNDYLVYRSFNIGIDLPEENEEDEKMFLVYGLRNIQVTYMHYDSVLEHAFLPHLEASALRLPLDSERYYLLVVLPVRRDAGELARLLNRMARESDLSDVYAALQPRRVRAVVPSFTVKGHVTLTTDLQKLGIHDVFEPRQHDFTPMTPQPGVYVRSIEQAVSVAIRKYQPDVKNRYTVTRNPVLFTATYPFLYFVMDSNIHVALMAGKMVDPLNTRIL